MNMSITDINECADGDHTCDLNTTKCENTIGSYKCICKSGYQTDGKRCKGSESLKLFFHSLRPYTVPQRLCSPYLSLYLISENPNEYKITIKISFPTVYCFCKVVLKQTKADKGSAIKLPYTFQKDHTIVI